MTNVKRNIKNWWRVPFADSFYRGNQAVYFKTKGPGHGRPNAKSEAK